MTEEPALPYESIKPRPRSILKIQSNFISSEDPKPLVFKKPPIILDNIVSEAEKALSPTISEKTKEILEPEATISVPKEALRQIKS